MRCRDSLRFRPLLLHFTQRIDRFDDRNRRSVPLRSLRHAADQLRRHERPHAVLYGDQLRVGAERRQSAPHRIEPLGASGDDRVRGHFEARREVFPEIRMTFGQHGDDFRAGQRRGHGVDRACQYRYAAQQRELFGQGASAAYPAASGHDDCSRACHAVILCRRFPPAPGRPFRAASASRAA